jgi:hypothetical protein
MSEFEKQARKLGILMGFFLTLIAGNLILWSTGIELPAIAAFILVVPATVVAVILANAFIVQRNAVPVAALVGLVAGAVVFFADNSAHQDGWHKAFLEAIFAFQMGWDLIVAANLALRGRDLPAVVILMIAGAFGIAWSTWGAPGLSVALGGFTLILGTLLLDGGLLEEPWVD